MKDDKLIIIEDSFEKIMEICKNLMVENAELKAENSNLKYENFKLKKKVELAMMENSSNEKVNNKVEETSNDVEKVDDDLSLISIEAAFAEAYGCNGSKKLIFNICETLKTKGIVSIADLRDKCNFNELYQIKRFGNKSMALVVALLYYYGIEYTVFIRDIEFVNKESFRSSLSAIIKRVDSRKK